MKRAGINRRQLKRTISKGLSYKFKKHITRKARADVERAKALMLAEFLNHSVTKELQGGKNASNLSGTLGGYGNLFSFIGFDSTDRPIPPVLRILESHTKLISVTKVARGNLAFEVVIDMPSRDDLAKAAPMPWAAARSWIVGIEQGLSGLGNFLVKPGGRSGGGIQVDGVIKGGRFKNTKYISEIINHLQSNLIRFLKT